MWTRTFAQYSISYRREVVGIHPVHNDAGVQVPKYLVLLVVVSAFVNTDVCGNLLCLLRM